MSTRVREPGTRPRPTGDGNEPATVAAGSDEANTEVGGETIERDGVDHLGADVRAIVTRRYLACTRPDRGELARDNQLAIAVAAIVSADVPVAEADRDALCHAHVTQLPAVPFPHDLERRVVGGPSPASVGLAHHDAVWAADHHPGLGLPGGGAQAARHSALRTG